MIREKKAKREISGNRAFLVVIILSAGIVFLSSLVGYIQNEFGIMHLENIIYGLLIVTAVFLIKDYLTEYRYSFFDDELIVEKILGKKVTPIATIKTRHIDFFGKLADVELADKDMQIDYCDINKRKAHVIKYTKNDVTKVLTLSPSEELIMHIQKSMDARDYDEVVEEKLIK